MANLELSALGPLELTADGEPVPLRPAQRKVLARLATSPFRQVRTESIIDSLWGESAAARARNTLQVHVSGIRSVAPDVILTEPDGYRLNPASVQVDVDTFTRLARGALEPSLDTDWDAVASQTSRALDLWRSEPFPELRDCEATTGARSELIELQLLLIERRLEAVLSLGGEESIHAELRRLVHEHPLRERLWEYLMVCEYRLGRQAEALGAYHQIARILGAELGIEPGPRLKELEDEILRQVPDAGRRALVDNPTNLPRPIDTLVGRESTIQSVLKAFDEHHVVTLFGEGGMGKTRVAIEVGWRAVDKHAGGVRFVELESATSESDVAAEIATTLQLSNSVGDLTKLGHLLRNRPMLLILDGAEATAPAVEAFCTAIAGARLRVLATRRSQSPSESSLPIHIGPLSTKPEHGGDITTLPAARLLVDRARATTGEFRSAELSDNTVLEILEYTGGNPLAIELAARWVGSVGPADFAQLRTELASISVSADIELAYRALPAVDQAVVRGMASLAGRGTLDTIRALSDQPPSRIKVAGSVSRIQDAGLLTRAVAQSGHMLYGLHPKVREFALDIIGDQDGFGSAPDRHARHFLDFSEQLDGMELGDIDLRMPDLRLALDWWLTSEPLSAATIANALAPYWVAKYLTWDGLDWYRRILEEINEPDLETLWWFGWVAYNANEHDLALDQYARLATRAPKGTLYHARAVYGRARLSILTDRPQADADLRESLEVFRAEGSERDVIECLVALGLSKAGTGHSAEAWPLLTEAIELLTSAGDPRQRALCHRFLSLAAYHDEAAGLAMSHAHRAVEIADSASDLRIRSGALLQLALVEATWGSIKEAALTISNALKPVPDNAWYDTMLVFNGALPVLELGGEHDAARNVVRFIDATVEAQGWQPLHEHNPVYAAARASLQPIPPGALPMSDVRIETEAALASIAAG